MKRRIGLWAVSSALLLAASGAAVAQSSPTAIAQLAQQFDRHPLILFGEQHRSREIHKFLQQLLRDPVFICRADDVVVEFGNSRLQALADEYISGGHVSEVQLQSLWRETAPPLTWNSPVYRDVYVTLREINRAHLCDHPIRVVLGDPPLDWSKVSGIADYVRFIDRDGHLAAVVEREVLARKRRALVISGKLHVMKAMRADQRDGDGERVAAEIIESRNPGSVFTVVSVPSREAAAALGLAPPPSFATVRGTTLAQADFGMTRPTWTAAPADASAEPALGEGLRMGAVVDGLLNLGADYSLYPSPVIYLDPVYQNELRRRAAIIKAYSGQDFLKGIDALVEQARRGPEPAAQ